ncbi:MAG: tRNA (guanosine(37)-N1)-methyltransferase TrmD [Planctomycetes bacterium]|jgi:tRNA (guanine37-N1)-methyltransferase|nr:tRNA (guanosine(37)-N1)-methyltransferase TrmD [Planctomycetota bacterium]
MKIDVLTLFPGMFEGILSESILRIAGEKGLLDVRLWDIREFTTDRHRSADDKPYGGGPGMVMKVEPVVACAEHVLRERGADAHIVLLTPQGRRFRQAVALELAAKEHLLLLCGHYEGFDERVRILLAPDEISVGDYVLSGGELPAMLIMDAVARLIPGVLGSPESLHEESFSEGGNLEYPHYTRPVEYRGLPVPDILLSGHHENIRVWREREARARTLARREKEAVDEEA